MPFVRCCWQMKRRILRHARTCSEFPSPLLFLQQQPLEKKQQ